MRPAAKLPTSPSPYLPAQGCVWTNQSRPVALACSYTPQQLRAAYNVPDELTGKGQTIALTLWYNPRFLQSNLDAFSALNGMPSVQVQVLNPPFNYSVQQILKNPPLPSFDNSIAVENDLDVQVVHGMAPDAKIIYINAFSSMDIDLLPAINVVLELGLANIMSNSWGSPLFGPSGYAQDGYSLPHVVNVYDDLFKQAAIIGVSVFFSSGDSGKFDTNTFSTVTTQFPASSPWVTAVGGTALALKPGFKNNYLFETPWGNNLYHLRDGVYVGSFQGGGGGGIMPAYRTPFFQYRKDVLAIMASSGRSHGRVVPDISALADPNTGFATVITQYSSFEQNVTYNDIVTVGGTSLSSPLVAAIVACAQEAAQRKGQPSFGFLAPLLYSLPASSRAFHDIVQHPTFGFPYPPYSNLFYDAYGGTNGTLGIGNNVGLPALRGYDNATGLGTPGRYFIAALVGVIEKMKLRKS